LNDSLPDGATPLCDPFPHHRLVSIHPFPIGNGRHARRQLYITALQQADRGDISALLAFARVG
jgi:hypothetical protein